ncbi:MAG: carbohydrate transporter rane protein 1, family [Herbinix sp.]|jgi:putative aldouronate transport system permease protein|nr:carbohydrate transporter rane protein 1, family [Herbinix sp.]
MEKSKKYKDLPETLPINKIGFWEALRRDYKKHKYLYWMFLPVVLYYLIFLYVPMGGQIIAFQNYRPAKGILESSWVGFENFIRFFRSPFAFRVIKNTIVISFFEILIGFPAPIILALMLNELKGKYFKRFAQTVTYMPHFISLVVACGMVISFVSSRGVITSFLQNFGIGSENLLANPNYYVVIYVLSGVWKSVGWGSIIYLATLSGVDQNLYEAAAIDGAGRSAKLVHITFPALIPIIAIQLIIRIGYMMSQGAEKVILLYSPVVYETADTIASYVYRAGLQEQNYSLGAAVGMLNSFVNLSLVFFANWFSRRYVKESLW